MQWKSGGLAALTGDLSRLHSSAMKGVVIRQGAIPAFLWPGLSEPMRVWVAERHSLPMGPETPQRPPWLNWLILLAFLWSSYQLAGLWFQRLHG